MGQAVHSARFRWLLLATTGACWAAAFFVPGFWSLLGIGDFGGVFVDLHGSLAASDAARAGIDPYAINRLDTFGRPHLYSSWWFAIANLGLTRADAHWLGPAILGVVLIVMVFMLGPKNLPEWMYAFAFLGSPAILMAVNRANNDLLVFLLICGALFLLARGTALLRIAAFLLIGAGIVLKYYPAALLVLLLSAPDWRQMAREAGCVALVCLLGWPSLTPALTAAAKFWTALHGFYSFGASYLLLEFKSPHAVGWSLSLLLVIVVVALVVSWRKRAQLQAPPMQFAAGSALICACFALGNTYSYKLVYAALILPTIVRGRGRVRLMGVALFASCWTDGISVALLNGTRSWVAAPAHRFIEHAALLMSAIAQWLLVAGAIVYLSQYVVARIVHLSHTQGSKALVQPENETSKVASPR